MNFFYAVNATPKPVQSQQSYVPRIVQTGLISSYDPAYSVCWPQSGSTLYDIVGNNDITLYGGLDQNYNTSGWFDLDGVVEYGRGPSFNYSTNKFSYGIWVKKDDNNGVQVVGGFGYVTNLEGLYIYQAAARYYARLEDTAAKAVQAINPINVVDLNKWLYLFVTWDGSDIVLRVFDGNGIITNATATSTNTQVNLTNNPLSVNMVMSEQGYYMDGQIGEFHFYDDVLTLQQIETNYNQTKARYGY